MVLRAAYISIAFILITALAAVFPFSVSRTYALSGFDTYVEVEVNPGQVDGDLTDFPVYVDLSDLPTAFWNTVTSSCGDIRVTKDDGTTEVPREVVSCDTGSNVGELHFQADGTLSSSATTTFRIYYDGSSSDYADSATFGRNAVWSDYRAVWHMNDTDSSTIFDSTGNGFSGSKEGANQPQETTDAKIGVAQDHDAENISISHPFTTNATVHYTSAWGRKDTTSGDNTRLFAMCNAASDHQNRVWFTDTNQANLFINGSTNLSEDVSVTLTDWNYYAITATENATARAYVNGVEQGSGTSIGNFSNNSLVGDFLGAARNGTSQWTGHLDEVRTAEFQPSDAWISTEYNNQNSPSTFYFVSAEQTEGGGGGQEVATSTTPFINRGGMLRIDGGRLKNTQI